MPLDLCIPHIAKLIPFISKNLGDIQKAKESVEHEHSYNDESLRKTFDLSIDLLEIQKKIMYDMKDSANAFLKLDKDYECRSFAIALSFFFQLSSMCCSYIFLRKLVINIPHISSMQYFALIVGLFHL